MKISKKLFYLFFPLIIGGIVGLFISNYIDYTTLKQPFFSPPKIFFPITWTILYLLMGISYYLYKKDYPKNSLIDIIYYLQLFVNALWSIIFFVWKARFLAIIWIIALLILIIYMIYLFFQKKKISSYLNIPYLLWTLFATYLTIGIYILN